MISFFCDILGISVPGTDTIAYIILLVFSCSVILGFSVALIRFLLSPIDILTRYKR